jgi:hypothetical protein
LYSGYIIMYVGKTGIIRQGVFRGTQWYFLGLTPAAVSSAACDQAVLAATAQAKTA